MAEVSEIRYLTPVSVDVKKKKCRTGVCKSLCQIKIDPDKCKGCSKCARNCPVSAITGEIKSPFTIDQSKCIKCGACLDNCPFGAISRV